MWRRIIYGCVALSTKHTVVYHQVTRRTSSLCEAYACSKAWQQSRQAEVLQRIEAGDLAVQISEKLDREGRVPAFDVDILANKICDLENLQLDFVQTIFSRFRHTNESLHMLPSTPYAFIRSLLERNEIPRLISILQDKVNYGIFLDYHLANMLLDQFIEKKLYREAAQVSFDLMLQEELGVSSAPLTRHLAWYACHQFWCHRQPGDTLVQTVDDEQAEEEEEEQEGEVWMRVGYIENPWYDDHFDIDDEELLLGKTFTQVATPSDSLLGRSYQLIGWALYQKFERALSLLRGWLESDTAEVVSKQALDQLEASLEAISTREPPTEEKDPGCVRMEDVKPYITAEQKERLNAEFVDLKSRLQTSRVSTTDVEPLLHDLVTTSAAESLAEDVSDQVAAFTSWEELRTDRLAQETRTIRDAELRESIAQRLCELKATQERLSYFEQEEQIGLGVERAPKIKPIEVITEDEQFVAPPSERGKGY